MPTPRSTPIDPGTRLRLLDAASGVFAERGFRAATVREICTRAGANVAAVNYHFGGKEELYGALLEHLGRQAIERHPPDRGVGPGADVEARLHAFVHSFLTRILDEQGVGCLVAREMIEPTGALDRLVDEIVRPLFGRVCAIVGEILGPDAGEDVIVLAARSVVGQCLFYRHARPVWQRLQPKERLSAERVDAVARHVTRFSLAGLRGYAEPARAGSTRVSKPVDKQAAGPLARETRRSKPRTGGTPRSSKPRTARAKSARSPRGSAIASAPGPRRKRETS